MTYRRLAAYSAIVALALALSGLSPSRAQDAPYPSKRITFVVGFAPGGFADTLARIVAQKLSERWGQTVVVENRAGAGGNVAAKVVAVSAADGYTVLVTTTAQAINQTLYRKLDYSVDDLVPAAMPASSPESFAIPPAAGSAGLAEFLGRAKDRPITFATAGVGSGSHIAGEYFFRQIAKVDATHVPFRGGAPAIQAILGGQVDAVVSSFGVVPYVADGKLRGLAVASGSRVAAIPDVPTFADAGFAGFEAASWVGFFLPARTPSEIVAKLNHTMNALVSESGTEKQLVAAGYQLALRDVPSSSRYLKSEVERWGHMVRAVGVSVD